MERLAGVNELCNSLVVVTLGEGFNSITKDLEQWRPERAHSIDEWVLVTLWATSNRLIPDPKDLATTVCGVLKKLEDKGIGGVGIQDWLKDLGNFVTGVYTE